MSKTLSFHGGTKTVTGSNYLIETDDARILIDCGLFQGSRYNESLNFEPFAYNPISVGAICITHSHADHVGRLPKLYKDGFRGAVLATEPSAAVMRVALFDTFEKMMQDAQEEGRQPMYYREDVEAVLQLIEPIRYDEPRSVGSLTVTFRQSSHILGSAFVEVRIPEESGERLVLFTGDLGNPPSAILNPIDEPSAARDVVIEAAYGNRLHEDRDERRNILRDTILETVRSGGALMIPSFAIERTQEILLELEELFSTGQIPHTIPVFVDSPLAIHITEVYSKFSNYMNSDAVQTLEKYGGLFSFPWLTFTHTVEQSKGINNVHGAKIIIAGSGMSQGGRILHHETRYLSDPKSTILFVGYQVQGSLGRRILDKEPHVTIFGQLIPVKCHVKAIGGYSAHADQQGLMDFLKQIHAKGNLARVFIVQGEPDAVAALGERVTSELGVEAFTPDQGASFPLDEK